MACDIHTINDLAASLKAEGRYAQVDLFCGQVGLLCKHEALPPEELAAFFPLWELNQNLELVAQRDFAGITARRPSNWSPIFGENQRPT